MMKSGSTDSSDHTDHSGFDLSHFFRIIRSGLSNRRWVWVSAVGSIVLFLIFIGVFFLSPWTVSHRSKTVEVTIQKGMTPLEIADRLVLHGVIPGKKRFLLGAKILGVTKRLQAGEYIFSGRMTLYRVLRKLADGHVITEWITFPEGSRATMMASLLQHHFSIDSVHFMSLVHDSAYAASLQIESNDLEGYLYPDTYRIQRSAKAEDVIRQMTARFFNIFDALFVERTESLNVSIHQIVTLASIVEGEAALESERPLISALYWNRLKRGMRLQADPTIQYIIPDGPRRLLNRDLVIDSPYNTYLYSGLPPGPVNNPGRASLYASLYPDSVDYLYMVANGDGSHTFSRSIRNHLEAKKRLDRLRNEIGRNR